MTILNDKIMTREDLVAFVDSQWIGQNSLTGLFGWRRDSKSHSLEAQRATFVTREAAKNDFNLTMDMELRKVTMLEFMQSHEIEQYPPGCGLWGWPTGDDSVSDTAHCKFETPQEAYDDRAGHMRSIGLID